MSENRTKKLEARHIDLSWLTVQRAKGAGDIDGTPVVDLIKECSAEIARLIVEGDQPDDPDDPDPPQKILKQAHYGGLGILLWFMHGSWKDKDLVEWTGYLNSTVKRIRREGFGVIDFFVWACNGKSGNWYSNTKIPFEIKDREVYFDVSSPKWWQRFDIFIETLYRWGIEPSMCFLPTSYTEWAFKHAKSGTMSFWSADALAYQIKFARKLISVVQKYYGVGFMPWLKANNELINHGDDAKGAMFAEWYVAIFDGIQDLFSTKDDVSKWIVDISFSEWPGFPFNYDETFEFRGYKLGQGRFLRNGRRKAVMEGHRYGCPENMTDGRVAKSLSANFPKSTPQIFHEDCGCGVDEDGKLIGKGAGIGQYHVGDNEQTFLAQESLHSQYKRKNRSAISIYMPLDCLKKTAETKGVYMEFMKVDELDWERPKEFIRGIKAGLE